MRRHREAETSASYLVFVALSPLALCRFHVHVPSSGVSGLITPSFVRNFVAEPDLACLSYVTRFFWRGNCLWRTRKLMFEAVDVSGGIPELTQSSVDCVVDVGLLDKLVTTQVQARILFLSSDREARAEPRFSPLLVASLRSLPLSAVPCSFSTSG